MIFVTLTLTLVLKIENKNEKENKKKLSPPLLVLTQTKGTVFTYLQVFNYKGNHQADSNLYSFWKHCFNRK